MTSPNTNPKDCKKFISCDANLCPLDPGLEFRTWFQGEPVCSNGTYKDLPFIRRQKKLNRKPVDGLEEKAMEVSYLTETAPVKRVLSEEQRQAQIERLRQFRFTSQNHPLD